MSRNTVRKCLAAGSPEMAEVMVQLFRLGLMLYLFFVRNLHNRGVTRCSQSQEEGREWTTQRELHALPTPTTSSCRE